MPTAGRPRRPRRRAHGALLHGGPAWDDVSPERRALASPRWEPAWGHRTIAWSDGNTYPLVVVEVTSWSHPFWIGTQRIMDSAGQVEKFHRRYGQRKGHR